MGSDHSLNHLTQTCASNFLAERSLLCLPSSPCKEPEKEILHGLVCKNKTFQFYRGRDLKRKREQNKSEEAQDKTEWTV